MTSFGYTLSSEEHGPQTLLDNARRAEELGFDFVSISDHYHPWVTAQGHSPFVWSVLGAIAAATERIEVGVGVTCPIMRIHPAVLAQAAATTSLLFDGRFFFGVGTGEALNEHIAGQRWPRPEIRREMLEEAIDVMRQLWTGDTVDHRGAYYEVENARVFDPPSGTIPVIVSGFGTEAAELSGRIGDGYWGNSPERELVAAFEKAGGSGPRYAQLNLCWAEDEASAKKTVHKIWPNAGVTGQLSQDLPTWTHFEQAAEPLTEEQVTESVPCGPDITDDVVKSVRQYVDAGYDHLYFHNIGPDQEGFFRFWESELGDAVAAS
jgi:G6PDH family F420-dependent oxidoreductase